MLDYFRYTLTIYIYFRPSPRFMETKQRIFAHNLMQRYTNHLDTSPSSPTSLISSDELASSPSFPTTQETVVEGVNVHSIPQEDGTNEDTTSKEIEDKSNEDIDENAKENGKINTTTTLKENGIPSHSNGKVNGSVHLRKSSNRDPQEVDR